MWAEPVEAPTEEELITSPLRFDMPGIIGDFDAGDLHWKVGRSASTAGVGTSSSPTA
jgi:hypothetical protein